MPLRLPAPYCQPLITCMDAHCSSTQTWVISWCLMFYFIRMSRLMGSWQFCVTIHSTQAAWHNGETPGQSLSSILCSYKFFLPYIPHTLIIIVWPWFKHAQDVIEELHSSSCLMKWRIFPCPHSFERNTCIYQSSLSEVTLYNPLPMVDDLRSSCRPEYFTSNIWKWNLCGNKNWKKNP